MREGRGRAEGGRMMVCGERKEVMMWQLMLAARQSQCVGNWTCTFSHVCDFRIKRRFLFVSAGT